MKIIFGIIVVVVFIYGSAFHQIGVCAEKRETYVRTVELYPKAVELIAKTDIEFRQACGHK